MGPARDIACLALLAALALSHFARADDLTPPGTTFGAAPGQPVTAPAAAPAAPPAPTAARDGEDIAAEMSADLQKQAAAYQKVVGGGMTGALTEAARNAGIASDGTRVAGGGAPGAEDDASPAGAPAQMAKMLESPTFKNYMKAMQSPEAGRALASAGEIMKHPNRMNLLYAEGIWLVLFMVLRAWFSSRAKTLGAKLWTSAWTACAGLVVSSAVLPFALIGPRYFDMAMQVFEVFKQARG